MIGTPRNRPAATTATTAVPITADTSTVPIDHSIDQQEKGRPVGFRSGGSETLAGFESRLKGSLLQWRTWTTKGAFSVADLGLASAANFGINIFMARGLPEREYGAFSVTYAMLLFAAGFQASYIFEPMSVLGPSRPPEVLKHYRESVFWLNLMLTLALSGLLAVWG